MKALKKTALVLCLIIAMVLTLTSCDKLQALLEQSGIKLPNIPGITQSCKEHDYKDGVCTICAKECEHEFINDIHAPTCTDKGYTEKTCSVCGIFTIADEVSAVGHRGNPCEICGCIPTEPLPTLDLPARFFYNIAKNNIGFNGTLVINDIEIAAKNSNTKFVFGELFINVSNGVIIDAYGKCDIAQTTTYDGKTEIMELGLLAYINDDQISIKTEQKENGLQESSYIIYPIASNEEFNQVKDILASLISTGTNTLTTVIDGNDDTVNKVVGTLFALAFDAEANTDGYTLSLSAEKLTDLNDRLYTMKLDELINYLAGDGRTCALIEEAVYLLLDRKVGDLLDEIEASGVDIDETVDNVVELIGLINGEPLTGTADSIKKALNSEENRDLTLEEAIIKLSNDSSVTSATIRSGIADAFISMKSITAYEIIADLVGEGATPESLRGDVDAALKVIDEYASFTVTTDRDANIKEINFKIDAYDGATMDISVLSEYTSEFDYAGIFLKEIEDIKNATAAISADKAAELLNKAVENGDIYDKMVFVANGNTVNGLYSSDPYFDFSHDEYYYMYSELGEGETLTLENVPFSYEKRVTVFEWEGYPIDATRCGDWLEVDIDLDVPIYNISGYATVIVDNTGAVTSYTVTESTETPADWDTSYNTDFYLNLKTGEVTGDEFKAHNYILNKENSSDYYESYDCDRCGDSYGRSVA